MQFKTVYPLLTTPIRRLLVQINLKNTKCMVFRLAFSHRVMVNLKPIFVFSTCSSFYKENYWVLSTNKYSLFLKKENTSYSQFLG